MGSTLAAESQAMVSATGTLEWASLVWAEALHGMMELVMFEIIWSICKQDLRLSSLAVKVCMIIWFAVTSPTSIEDRRTSVDIVILRQSLERLKGSLRWVPTNRMLADSLAKNAGDPADLLRACSRQCTYQVSPEQTVLQLQADER